MSTSVLKALPGRLDIKRHSPSILYLFLNLGYLTMPIVFNLLQPQVNRYKEQTQEKLPKWLNGFIILSFLKRTCRECFYDVTSCVGKLVVQAS